MENILVLSVPDIFDDVFDGRFQFWVFAHVLFDLIDGVDDRRMISAAEFIADVFHGHSRDLANGIDCDLTRIGDIGVSSG